jgi:ketol-acid reductoisomerase
VFFHDDDADLSLVQDRHVAVLGYDADARAHALCLRDSGVDVRVGLPPGDELWDDAEAEGLRVVPPYDACEEADVLVLPALLADDARVSEIVVPNLVPGCVVVLGADAAVPNAELPEGVDVVRLVAWADGARVREEFNHGRGVPVFASVVVDGSGAAWEQALAYARAVGATRAGVVRTGDEQYVVARAAATTLARRHVLPAVGQALDALVRGGCPVEVAYVECVRALDMLAADLSNGALDEALGTPGDAKSAIDVGRGVRSLMGWFRLDTTG